MRFRLGLVGCLAVASACRPASNVAPPRPDVATSQGATLQTPDAESPGESRAPASPSGGVESPDLALPRVDGALYSADRFAIQAELRGDELVLLDAACQVHRLDAVSGASLRAVIQLRPAGERPVECPCRLVADVAVCFDQKRQARAFDLEGDSVLWSKAPRHPDFGWSFMGVGGRVVALEGAWARMGPELAPRLLAFDSRSGRVLWERALDGNARGGFARGRDVATDGHVVVLWTKATDGAASVLWAYEASGAERWSRRFEGVSDYGRRTVVGASAVAFASNRAELLDAASGQSQIEVNLPSGASAVSLSVDRLSLYLGYDQGGDSTLEAFSRSDGRRRWTHRAQAGPTVLASSGTRFVAHRDNRASVFDAATGRQLWHWYADRTLLVERGLLITTGLGRTDALSLRSDLATRSVTLRVQVATSSRFGASGDRTGLLVRAGDGRAVTNARGEAELTITGRGRVRLTLSPGEWMNRQAPRDLPPYTFPCFQAEPGPRIDLESEALPEPVQLRGGIDACIIDP